MSEPTIGSFGQLLYDDLEQFTGPEAKNDWPLKSFVGAIGTSLDEVNDYVREGENDEPGWSSIVDLDRAPDKVLPWLAQFNGVRMPPIVPDDQRAYIRNAGGQKRGTPLSIVAAAQAYLVGNRTVIMRERDGGAYKLTIVTFTSETPNSTLVRNSILAQKPAGITLTYVVEDAQDYQFLLDTYPTYEDAFTHFFTYEDLFTGTSH